MNIYLLLERTDSLLKQLYRRLPDPAPTLLFDKTELAAYRDKSPVLLDASIQHPLLNIVLEHPDAWPGLIIESASPVEVVLAHLRHILFVRFEGVRRGVLRYSHPVTASYLFTADTAQSSAQWLGPMSRLRWYGGTWADVAQGNQRWMSIDNPHAPHWVPPQPPVPLALSQRQEDALRRQIKEFPQ
ncbi:hypothetical protein ALQ33_02187 [Pseudomonas syringae pv. philadelphi]|uniref:DUF4123 domain-containing protein n=1 Tax=Pseudomonas syringae pv. philadelphi TaxID=251706 RepID=A0A3M3YCN7_9PSED|nr:DUF4123 domain-containing protein [Pseudomonas syringae group genomosp. 3]RMO79891.1 hypothetical protein ALQ33_02187 [Pseudomonas syringae pv. philadelphi]